MNFIKKMCILRQVKQGFSGDGKTLSGLVKIEQYGKNLSVEISVINVAPLSSGEYYCLVADSAGRTEMLPLRGKSLFNIVSQLDVSDGFCGIICFVKNGIVPIAYGINGQTSYDWRTLVKNSSQKGGFGEKESAFSGETANLGGDKFEAGENGALWGVNKTAQPTFVSSENEGNPPIVTGTNEKSEKTAGGAQSGYDDETVATENYYGKEKNIDERVEPEKNDTYAYAESGNTASAKAERTDSATNGDAENVRHPYAENPDGYYLSVKNEIDALFAKYPADETLKDAFESSEWVRVKEQDRAEYLIGVIYEDLKAKYICYALPAENPLSPPEEIKDISTFVPSNSFNDKEGFFVIFQSCASGECIRPQSL